MRLKRLALYEREVTAISLESVKELQRGDEDEFSMFKPISGVRQTIKRLETALGFVIAFNSRAKNEPVDSALAAELSEAIAEDLGVDIYDENEIEFPDYPDGADLDTVEWTPEYLKTFLGVICEHGGSGLDAALAKRIAKWRVELAEAKARVKSLEIEADRKKRQRIVPNGLELEKIARYEAHLERSLYRALHEVQRVQANRKGQVVAPFGAAVVETATT